ncbi:hypothetical protein KSD_29510 [Ktedonobacter sp. SOSP1-85]|nr:hypothetical protein KSD_29510 [Ktedonobacter sp. SOSP1-85]
MAIRLELVAKAAVIERELTALQVQGSEQLAFVQHEQTPFLFKVGNALLLVGTWFTASKGDESPVGAAHIVPLHDIAQQVTYLPTEGFGCATLP